MRNKVLQKSILQEDEKWKSKYIKFEWQQNSKEWKKSRNMEKQQ